MAKPDQQRREVPSWVIGSAIAVVVVAMVVGLVWGIAALFNAATGPGGPGNTSVSWQCTEFGDRLYWATGYASRGFAVVPGGCR